MDITWLLVLICLLQSALFAGLTIGLFGLSRLRLEIEAESNNEYAEKILIIRKDSNFLLTTLLWGNVAVNVLIALLTESIMSGGGAFLFSTIGITMFGEIIPQAYFSRHALRISVHLIPMIRFYQILLYPVAKPSAVLLDWWLGKEELQFFKEQSLMIMLEKQMGSDGSDISKVEGKGALNFLMMDDIRIEDEGSVLDQKSIIKLPFKGSKPCFPEFEESYDAHSTVFRRG
jgi:CBS domain containing-hemolysin-like protein